MAEKRRLPIIQSNPKPGDVRDAGGTGGTGDHGEGEDESPPWHWVPLGALISLAIGVVLARSLYVPFQQRAVERVYGHVSSAEDFARVDATLPQGARDALQFKLSIAGLAVAVISVLLGGFAVGRFGAKTNARHGTLAGLTTTVLLVLFVSGRFSAQGLLGYLLLIPLGGVMGWVGARVGVALRDSP